MNHKAKPAREERPLIVLSPQQELAIAAILAGQRYNAAADAAGVAPETVSRWLSGDSAFVAELNARRAALWEGQADRCRALVGRSLGVLEEILNPENDYPPMLRFKAAAAVLSAAQLGKHLAPAGPVLPEAVEKAWTLQEHNAKMSLLDLMAMDPLGFG